ncbi:MAG: glycosyltransferase family 4 protein [Candidatus Competibacter sp.]|nr:glycosyltransferase family 4 protein [Candidatus Competibacter sp.]MDG4583318.1 glycosyltransferase family 4 protein [Candidatus Competibacter sp.]
MSEKAPRLLLSAYQCGPGMGSVSQIGWHWYSRLVRRLPVTLVTHVRNRPALEAAGAPLPGSEVIYIDTEWFAGPLYRLAARLFRQSQHAVFLVSSADFYMYDRATLKELRRRRAAGADWDIVHAVTPVSPMAATRLHKLGRPVVLGPWNGGLGNPAHFPDIMRADAAWLYPVRKLGGLVDALAGSSRNAAAILTATQATMDGIVPRHRPRCVPMLENGVDLNVFSPGPWPEPPGPDRPLRLAFVGRLVPFKGITMLLEAMQRVAGEMAVDAVLVGGGPLEADLRAEAAARGLAGRVRFVTENLSAAAVAAEMRAAHLFCLPSVRESGGAVLLEAMACARPVTAVAFGGPAEIVDDAVGRTLPPTGREAVVGGLVEVFRDVVAQPGAWRARGEEGLRRARERYGWEAKVDAAVELYRRLLADDE